MEKKIKIGLIGIIVIGVVLLSGCIEQKTSDTSVVSPVISICKQVKDSSLSKVCIAIVNGDVSLCNKIERYNEMCYEKIAIKNKDHSICENIGDSISKDLCYFEIASIKKDNAICERITDIETKYTCYAIVKKDISLCKNENILSAETCYWNVAVKNNDPSICEKIKDNTCYYKVATETRDILLCEKITDQTFLITCNALIKNEPSMCNGLENLRDKDWCYSQVAEINKDIDICKKMSEANDCAFNVALRIVGISSD